MASNADLAQIQAGQRGLVLNTLADMQTAAQIILQSHLAPDSFKTKEQIFVAIQQGAEIGLRPMQSLNSLYVVRGKATLWGDAALGLVKKSGMLKEYKEVIEGTGDSRIAKVKSVRVEANGQLTTVESSFSVDDAKVANLWNKKSRDGKASTWITHPNRMLKYKARAFNLRDNFPDVLQGMHLTEEFEGEELLTIPDCDTPSRDERRKVESKEVADKLADTINDVAAQAAATKEIPEQAPPQEETPPSSEEPSPVTDDKEKERVKDTPGDGSVVDGFMPLYKAFGVEADKRFPDDGDHKLFFQSWSQHVLCAEAEEVSEAIKYTGGMVRELQRELDAVGISDEIMDRIY